MYLGRRPPGRFDIMEQQFDHDSNITFGALVAATVAFGNSKMDAARAQGFRLIMSRITAKLTGKTTAEGPLMFGICCNVPTVAELKAYLENDPQGISSDDAKGKNWFVKILGQIPLAAVSDSDVGFRLLEADIVEVKYGKNGWSIPEGSFFNYFVYNMGSTLTTGGVITIAAEHFGVWLKD